MPNLDQQLFDAYMARFALISTANGYLTNIGARVKEWQTTELHETERPATLVHDPIGVIQRDPNGQNSSKHTWANTVIVDAVTNENGQNAKEARKALSDLRKAIGVDPTWGGLARRTEEVSIHINRDKSGANITGPRLVFKVITSRKPWEA